MASEEEKRKQEDSSRSSWPYNPTHIEKEGEEMKVWGILLFGLIGATATTIAVGQLRRSIHWFYTQLSSLKGATGGPFRSSFREEAWKRYNRRMKEEYEDEMERVERIRRMQSVFNRERNKHKRSYESWGENGPGQYHQHFQRNDWYWKAEKSYREQRTNSRATPKDAGNVSLSHHYTVLGLDRCPFHPKSNSEQENIKLLACTYVAEVRSSGSKNPAVGLLLQALHNAGKLLGMLRSWKVALEFVPGTFGLLHLEHLQCLGSPRHHNKWPSKPYSDTEVKTAFRAKAMECHPDQNKDNKEAAEAKFKEVLLSYEAIKSENKNEKR